MSALFEPYTLKDVTLRNRIAIPPMCQYMAEDGMINDWHHVHLASLARGGAGLLVVEATAVAPEGRITPGCAGIWSDAHAQAFVPVVQAIKAAGSVPGIQIAHAGRKASANRPWEGDDHIAADDARGWETIAPSAIAFGAHLPKVPREMTLDDIARVKQDFVDAARRAEGLADLARRLSEPALLHRCAEEFGEAPRHLVAARQAGHGGPQALGIERDDRQDGAGLDHHLEQLDLLAMQSKQRAREDQVAGGGDRQEFGEAFDHPHQGGLDQQCNVHETGRRASKPGIVPGVQRRPTRHS